MSKFIFSSPRKYVQGAGVLDELGTYLTELGDQAFLVADEVVWKLIGERKQQTLQSAGVKFSWKQFNGEASSNEITRLSALAKSQGWAAAKRWTRLRRWRTNLNSRWLLCQPLPPPMLPVARCQ